MNYVIEYTLHSNNRVDIRNELVNLFLREEPGCGTGELSSRYKYVVEKKGGYNIYLQRPAPLNKGFDFIVNVENLYFNFLNAKKHKSPSHSDIMYILTQYKHNYPQYYEKLKNIIYRIYQCENIDIFSLTNNFPFFSESNFNISIELVLLVIKWLFIEQDITYWNFSGRKMLFDAFTENELL